MREEAEKAKKEEEPEEELNEVYRDESIHVKMKRGARGDLKSGMRAREQEGIIEGIKYMTRGTKSCRNKLRKGRKERQRETEARTETEEGRGGGGTIERKNENCRRNRRRWN